MHVYEPCLCVCVAYVYEGILYLLRQLAPPRHAKDHVFHGAGLVRFDQGDAGDWGGGRERQEREFFVLRERPGWQEGLGLQPRS